MGLFDSLFENKALKKSVAINAGDSISRAVVGGRNTFNYSVGATNWDFEKTVSNAYERVIWVFRCVDTIASNQASLSMFMKEYDADYGHKIEDKRLNKLLNHRTNQFEDSWAFRYRLSSQLLLSPNGAYIELVRNAAGEVVEMYLLDPGSVQPVKDNRKFVSAYKVKRADGGTDTIDKEDVLWIHLKKHPLDPYRQMTPIIPAAIAVETDYLARVFNRNFLKNDGRPGMLIGVKGDMSTEDALELRELFNGGYRAAGQVRVIEAENIDAIDLGSKPRDAQWAEAVKSAKDDILEAFGVPESVLGNSSNRCLRASERVFLANGQIKRAEELVGTTFELLQVKEDGQRTVKATAEYALKEPIYRVTTFSGRTIETNGKHPLYIAASYAKGPFKRDIHPWGWTDVLNIKKHFDENDNKGNVFTEIAVPIKLDQVGGNAVDEDMAWDDGAACLEVPDYIFTATNEAQRSFASGLYSAHGLLSQHTSFDVYVPSREYAVKLQALLVRLGVHACINSKKLKHLVSVSGKINMFNLLYNLYKLEGENVDKVAKVFARLDSETSRENNALRTDALLPGLVWDRIYNVEEIGEDQTVAISLPHIDDKTYLSMFWEHNTYNNASNEEETFWTKTMMPHCDAIARGLEPLTGDEEDETYITYDYAQVDVIQRIQRRKEDEVKQDFARGILTGNDVLKYMGKKEVDNPYMRVYFHPSRLVGGDPADLEVIRYLPVIGATQQPGPGMNNPFLPLGSTGGDGKVGEGTDLIQGALAANGTDIAGQTINDQAARTMRSARTLGTDNLSVNPNANVNVRERVDALVGKKDINYFVKQIDTNTDPHQELRIKIEGLIEGQLDSWSNRQLKVAKDRLEHAKVRKGTRHWTYDTEMKDLKPLDTEYVVNTKEWADDAFEGVFDSVYRLLNTEYVKITNSLRDQNHIAVDYIILDNDTLTKIVTASTNQVLVASKNQSELLRKHIGVLDNSGSNISNIQAALHSKTFDRERWTVNLAKMVSTNAIESLYHEIYARVDGKTYKIWCSGKDEHYRAGHGSLHGTKLGVKDTFTVNGKTLSYPGEGYTEEGISCSCWLVYGIDN